MYAGACILGCCRVSIFKSPDVLASRIHGSKHGRGALSLCHRVAPRTVLFVLLLRLVPCRKRCSIVSGGYLCWATMPVLQPRGVVLSTSLFCFSKTLSLLPFKCRRVLSVTCPGRTDYLHFNGATLGNSVFRSAYSAAHFSSEPPRRCKNTFEARSSRSLFADELSACDTSKQVLEILRSPSVPLSSSASSQGVMLLPQDCLAFLNALLRVQLLRRTGPEFLHFCDLLEASLKAYNVKVEKEEEERMRKDARCSSVRNRKESSAVVEWEETARRRADYGRFIRAVLQKLADLKAPLAFQRMVRSLVLSAHVQISLRLCLSLSIHYIYYMYVYLLAGLVNAFTSTFIFFKSKRLLCLYGGGPSPVSSASAPLSSVRYHVSSVKARHVQTSDEWQPMR